MKKFRDEMIQYGLRVLEIDGDGNCLFRAVCDQLEGSQGNYRQYRNEAIDYIVQNKDDFAPFIDDDQTFDEYIEEMSEDGIWGGNLELQALAMRYRFNVIVHQLDAPIFSIANFDQDSVRTIHLSYHLGEHYNSVRLIGNYSFLHRPNPNNIDDFSTNEQPAEIPHDLQKVPERLTKFKEEEEKKLQENGKKFKQNLKKTAPTKPSKESKPTSEPKKIVVMDAVSCLPQ